MFCLSVPLVPREYFLVLHVLSYTYMYRSCLYNGHSCIQIISVIRYLVALYAYYYDHTILHIRTCAKWCTCNVFTNHTNVLSHTACESGGGGYFCMEKETRVILVSKSAHVRTCTGIFAVFRRCTFFFGGQPSHFHWSVRITWAGKFPV